MRQYKTRTITTTAVQGSKGQGKWLMMCTHAHQSLYQSAIAIRITWSRSQSARGVCLWYSLLHIWVHGIM